MSYQCGKCDQWNIEDHQGKVSDYRAFTDFLSANPCKKLLFLERHVICFQLFQVALREDCHGKYLHCSEKV